MKYGPKGQTVRVRITRALPALGRVPAAGGRVLSAAHIGELAVLEVMDEGPGVPTAEREAIWRPYQRGAAARQTAGSGIGLSVVADVVAEHGGRYSVKDGPGGRGAVFRIELPAVGSRGPRAEGREPAEDLDLERTPV